MDYIPKINLSDYDYDLPNERIALYPPESRGNSKLLCVTASTRTIEHRAFHEISGIIPPRALIVVNTTKVIAARLKMKKPAGGKAEILCVDPVEPSTDPVIAMASGTGTVWNCIIGGRSIREGMELIPADTADLQFTARIIKKADNAATVEFNWDSPGCFSEILANAGRVPLPPYIKRDAEDSDKERYQTVYARLEGSVAAPTAGLHFTDEIIGRMKHKGISFTDLTLHVGPGTFKPIEAGDIAGHAMHNEQVLVSRQAVASMLDAFSSGKKVIATGTTSLRTMESIYWLGTRIILGEIDLGKEPELWVGQWDTYRIMSNAALPAPAEAFDAVLKQFEKLHTDTLHGYTELFIMPGYDVKTADGLITNFHTPKSTLILLVASILGRELWQEAYESALAGSYKFLSYGDTSLILKRPLT